MTDAMLQCYHANGSGVARISMWKSLSDVADHVTLMHVAWQRVLATSRTLAQQKVLDLKLNKATMLDLKFVLEKG
jgi:hypothetical protein